MTHPKEISIQDYTYTLPEERIARYPLEQRDASKLLIYRQGTIKEDIYRHIAGHLAESCLLVFNNTKVIEARLLFQKSSGGMIEIFCLEPHEQYPDIIQAMLQKGKVYWQCLVGGASKWKPGQVLVKEIRTTDTLLQLEARYREKRTGAFVIEMTWSDPTISFAEILHLAGAIPLPPYIKRTVEETDKDRYQTVYAQEDGSVAAPTAGLHFTERIFNDLKLKKIKTGFVTLHVGAGTFKPVKSEKMEDHDMHAEWIDVSREFILNLLHQLKHPIIAVGTTSLRTLESLYWLGCNCSENAAIERSGIPVVSQWEPYEKKDSGLTAETALTSLLEWMDKNKLERLVTKTQILIAPGYQFKIINGLITNFHQPQSTLLLLVAALVGRDWKKIYDHALQNDYRFLSYGDGSLLWKKG